MESADLMLTSSADGGNVLDCRAQPGSALAVAKDSGHHVTGCRAQPGPGAICSFLLLRIIEKTFKKEDGQQLRYYYRLPFLHSIAEPFVPLTAGIHDRYPCIYN